MRPYTFLACHRATELHYNLLLVSFLKIDLPLNQIIQQRRKLDINPAKHTCSFHCTILHQSEQSNVVTHVYKMCNKYKMTIPSCNVHY